MKHDYMNSKCEKNPFQINVLTKSLDTWSGLPFKYFEIPPIPTSRHVFRDASYLSATISGERDVKWSAGSKKFETKTRAGSLIYLDHQYELGDLSSTGSSRIMSLELNPHTIEQLTGINLSTILLSRHLPPHIVDQDQHICALMQGMEVEIRNGCPSGRLYAESISLAVLSYLWGRFSVRHSIRMANGLSQAGLKLLKDYLNANLGQDIGLIQMAELVGLSPKHLSRCFKESTGESPYQYLLRLRVNEAKRLLYNGNFSMTEIAYSVGFSTPSHFSMAFRKVTGVSPSEFQRSI